MVASRSDTKRRRRDSSPLDSNPKRTKVHAQRKFAQGVSSLSNLVTLTPVKEKDKLRNNGLGGSAGNGLTGPEGTVGQSDVAAVGKRALPARGAKKPSIDDMITFLCYRGTSALPAHLVHLNKAPSPEPASQQLGSNGHRSKLGDKASRERDKANNKKALKSAASSAQKAVTAAQALKRKYQEQRIKKTSGATITTKVKAAPLLRTTRSSAGAVANISSRDIPKKIILKKGDIAASSKKKDASVKDESAMKSSSKASTSKASNSKVLTSPSGSRGGLRSGGILSENVLRTSSRKLGPNVSIKKKKASAVKANEGSSPSKKLASSLSDFSSEDDQPLVKKPKALAQVQKLIKKSIANIGRKMKLEPRRSKRGLSMSPTPPSTSSAKKTLSGSSKLQAPSTSSSRLTSPKESDASLKTTAKRTPTASKEVTEVVRRSSSQETLKKDLLTTPKSSSSKVKKGNVMDVVDDPIQNADMTVETRTRRGSRDLRDISAEEKNVASQNTQEALRKLMSDKKKKDLSKSTDVTKTLLSGGVSPKVVNTKVTNTPKTQVELSLSAVLKSPPDLRIPPSIKRPLTAVGITNPMAIAAAAAVVCKTSLDKSKNREPVKSEDLSEKKKGDVKLKEQVTTISKSLKDESKSGAEPSKAKQTSEIVTLEKDVKSEKTKSSSSLKKKQDDHSEEESKVPKDTKKVKVKAESSESSKENPQVESPKPSRHSRRSNPKGPSDEEENISQGKTITKSSDADDSKLSSRARRSNNRALKKVNTSDEEESNDPVDTKTSSRRKSVTNENENDLDSSLRSKKYRTRQPSDDELETRKTNKTMKQSSKTLEESSENDGSDCNSQSDDSSSPALKPSTRSATRGKVKEFQSSRSTRLGRKTLKEDEEFSGSKSKQRQKSENNNTSSENESDSVKTGSSKAPKTRSRNLRNMQSKRESLSESSDDESDDKSSPQPRRQARRSTIAKRTTKSNVRGSSSDTVSSPSEDADEDDDYENDSSSVSKAKRKPKIVKSDSKPSAKSSRNKRPSDARSSRTKMQSDEDSDTKKKMEDREKQKSSKSAGEDSPRRSRSPRRSSRRSVKSKAQDSKSEESEDNSSESSPSQNRRVLRERRVLYSFAEVDPPSDSEEDVIAATKASLEMINHPKSSEPESPMESKKSAPLPLESDQTDDNSFKAKTSSEQAKGAKKSKVDSTQPKKTLSKKRVKSASEVQPNLNEELEKTLMSINLSPQMATSTDKSPDRSAASAPSPSSNTVIRSPLPVATSKPPHKVAAVETVITTPSPPGPHRGLALPPQTTALLPSVSSGPSPFTPGKSTPSQTVKHLSLETPNLAPAVRSTASSVSVSLPVSSNTVMSMAATHAAQGPLLAPMATAMSSAMAMPMSMSMPINQLGMTLPHGAPFLVPMLAPVKKESGAVGGIPNQQSPLMVGMNQLVVNNNRTFFLSTGNTMTMSSNQQQMVPGPLMPSLLSLRLPDKPAGQQTIVTSTPVYLPIFGNGGIIQTQGQNMAGMPTIIQNAVGTSMATMATMTNPVMAASLQNTVAVSNIQNTLAANMQNTVAVSNIQNTMAANMQNTVAVSNIQNMAANIQNTVTSNIQNIVAPNIQNAVVANVQNLSGTGMQSASSISSAMTLTQTQGAGAGTGMKRQLVLATKNGPVSKLILSVGEDGSHVLAAANPNIVTTSEGQTLMSVMQPIQTFKQPASGVNIVSSQSSQPRLSTSTIAPKLSSVPSKYVQSVSSSISGTSVAKQPAGQTSDIPGTMGAASAMLVNARMLQTSLPATISLPSSTTVQLTKPGMPKVGLSANIITSSPSSLSIVTTTGSSTAQSFSVARTTMSSSPRSTLSMSAHTTPNTAVYGRVVPSASSIAVKPETKSNPIISVRPSVSSTLITSSASFSQPLSHSSTSVMSKMVVVTSAVPVASPSSRTVVAKPLISASLISSSLMQSSASGSPSKSSAGDLKVPPSTCATLSPTSRIPSAHAALAALGSPSSTRAIAKTGSSRKPYSTAPSYASVSVSAVSSSPSPAIQVSPASVSLALVASRMTNSKPPAPKVSSAVKVSPSPTPLPSKAPAVMQAPASSESVRKGTEVELASTHRTLTMLSTAFQGMGKDRKRDIAVKKTNATLHTSVTTENKSDQLNMERSGLDSLAEIATSLAERSGDASGVDKRTPEHSLWANPAQILGRETIRVPGLPITANVGSNLPTKNDLAKMKSGAVLADAVEKKPVPETDKLSKVKVNPVNPEKSSVSGLLTSSKADTPRQKVQKWLDDGSKGDVEHQKNCSLLSNGSSCTCDVLEEDISNLNSLADICVSMERINSPVRDATPTKQCSKLPAEKKKKQEYVEPAKGSPQSSPAKPSPPLNSHQMKVAWQNAFGVKSPAKSSKSGSSVQPKVTVSVEESIKNQLPVSVSAEKSRKSTSDKLDQSTPKLGPKHDKKQSRKNDIGSSGSANESPQEKKSAQRRSLLGRAADLSQSKLDSTAFSADNESSVYAFEADTDAPPVSQPYRRRSKTLSRSDEEDSMSIGSTSNPVAVQVSKDPVFIPIQVESDEGATQSASEKTGGRSTSPQNDNSDVYYIPLGGQEGNEGGARAVAVRLGKEGPNNRVVMSAKLVKKPPTFKHPNDSHEDGFPNKRAKIESSPLSPSTGHVSASHQPHDPETSSTNHHSHSDIKSSGQTSANDSSGGPDKNKMGHKETSRSSVVDSSGEDTSSLSHMPSSSKDLRESRSSMSPASSRNRSPVSDKASPPNKKKSQGRFKRQSSIDSDASEKIQFARRGSKSKSSRVSPSPSLPSTSSTSSGPSRPSQKSNRSYNGPVPGNVSEAPVFHPSEKEFQDPYAYIEKIRPIAEKYGLCRIVAPNNFKPDCNVEDDIRFTADNQYVHKMMDRWGPNAKEMRAIVKYIDQHNIHLKHPPLVGGMELDLPRLYTTVQNFGGLMEVMDKKRWTKVAETMRIPKSAQDRASKLDEVYCKCLLPYETLKTGERDNLFEMVEVEWEMRKERRDKRLAASAGTPEASGAQGDSTRQDEEDEDEEEDEEEEEDECIVKGRSMPLTTFYRTARNTIHMWFKGSSPSASEVEHEFWRHVRDRNFHICVNAGSVDCSDPPYGFPTRNSPFAKHPWNLKVFSNNNGSVLRSLGSVIGVTVPTLHFGMVFTTCCWYRDPHNLPWVEYLHTGAKKIWYGIPEHGGDKFREAMQEVAPHYVRKKALWLASDTAMIPPNMLTERKVPLCRTVQEPGQFIVVFPRAHTSSVATGYMVSESVSFAPPHWIPTATESFKEMQNCNEPPLFSLDKLIFSIAEDQRTTLNVLNLILPAVMEILEREISGLREVKKMGVGTERMERSRKKSSGKKAKSQKEAEDIEVMECDVCSTNLYLSMLVNTDDDVGYCVTHGLLHLEQKKLSPNQCKFLHMYNQNELHAFCQTLLDRIETKSGKKGSNLSSNNSDSGSCASTSTRN